MSYLLTPEQDEKAEAAYKAAAEQLVIRANEKTNVGRYFFFAGAQLGLELAHEIYKETYETTRD